MATGAGRYFLLWRCSLSLNKLTRNILPMGVGVSKIRNNNDFNFDEVAIIQGGNFLIRIYVSVRSSRRILEMILCGHGLMVKTLCTTEGRMVYLPHMINILTLFTSFFHYTFITLVNLQNAKYNNYGQTWINSGSDTQTLGLQYDSRKITT